MSVERSLFWPTDQTKKKNATEVVLGDSKIFFSIPLPLDKSQYWDIYSLELQIIKMSPVRTI